MGKDDLNIHLWIHVVQQAPPVDEGVKLDAILKTQQDILAFFTGGASSEVLKSLADRAQHSAEGAVNLEKSVEDLNKQ